MEDILYVAFRAFIQHGFEPYLQKRSPDRKRVCFDVLEDLSDKWSEPFPQAQLLRQGPMLRTCQTVSLVVTCSSLVIKILPPITPAINSAAPRCLFCSLSAIKRSTIGFNDSKGSSSRTWTIMLSEAVNPCMTWIYISTSRKKRCLV